MAHKGLRYAGKVGTGFNDRSLPDIAAELEGRTTGKSALANPPRLKGAIWVEPDLVCEVQYTQMTRDGSLRHPSFQDLRQDKSAKEVCGERAMAKPKTRQSAQGSQARSPPGHLVIGGLHISRPDRVMDASSDVSKGELAEYTRSLPLC